jgi:NAD(P)-dependent dehydrogenase (short-subunit alcohol dehydrogenase family)
MTPVALVTGAARGIGRACAQRLGRDGYLVVAADIDGGTLDACVRELQTEGVSIEGRRLDVADTVAGRRLVEQVVATHGRIDALINNAGFTERVFVQDLTTQAWERMLAVHVRGPVFLTQAVARDMVRRGEPGAVVNLSSIRAESAEPGQMHYCAAKGALRTLTRAIAQELAPHRIRVNCVGAGLTATDMTADVRADAETMAQRRAQVPLSRYARPEEIAACAAFLLSDDAAHITGTTLYVDGGYLAV